MSEIDPTYAQELLWTEGIVAPWYLRPSQLDLYELLVREQFPFIEAARRFGKTTSILAFVLEKLIQNPGWICRWCFPFKNQAREVLLEEVAKMQANCPEEFKFNYHTTDSVYVGPRGSKLYIRGVNEDRGESARGPASNIIIADEYGFWKEPQYIVKNVLLPQIENQEGQWIIKASTPPPDLGHVYYSEKEIAIRKGRFVQKTIYDKETLTETELNVIIEESGGVTSPAFRRERLCEAVSDPEKLIVPEYSEELNDVPDDYPRPEFFDAYTGGDSGVDDNTAVLFAYYDFVNAELVFDDEYVINGRTTREIVTAAKAKEKELWADLKPYRRVYDAPKQIIYDIYRELEWPVSMPEKDDKNAAIHQFRDAVRQGKVKIKKRCHNLRRQLKVGLWKDDKHLDFQRSDGLGHLDAIAAAIYLYRSIDKRHNPWPRHLGLSHHTHFIPPEDAPLGETEQALASAFGSRRRGS